MPPWLLYTLGVLIFAFGLLLSIALHEIGHMVPAKKFGVKVTQYMVGFGPTLWSRKRGDTEYGLKAIPLGGYIRMIGMVPPRADGKRSRWPRRLATAVEDYRQLNRAELDPADSDREFYRLTPGKKMIVMLGGPCMNLLIFLILTVLLFMIMGQPKSDNTTAVGGLVKCVVPASSTAAQADTCPTGAPRAPAFDKLKPGDEFVSFDGVRVTSWDQLIRLIQSQPVTKVRSGAGTKEVVAPVHVVVRRAAADGTTSLVPITLTPVVNANYVGGSATEIRKVPYIGFDAKQHFYFDRLTVARVPGQIGSQLKLGVDALGKYPSKIAGLWRTVFEGKKRDINGAVGVVGIGRISGDFAKSPQLSAKDKVFTLLELLASVNLLLFLFNLIPLLPLDGGHVAGALVEAARRGRARLRARGRPVVAGHIGADGKTAAPAHKQIFVDTAQMLPIVYAVASVLVILSLLTLYADIVHPISLSGG